MIAESVRSERRARIMDQNSVDQDSERQKQDFHPVT